jgi:hypothetical protein
MQVTSLQQPGRQFPVVVGPDVALLFIEEEHPEVVVLPLHLDQRPLPVSASEKHCVCLSRRVRS